MSQLLDELPEIMTIEEAAGFLRVERHLIYRLIATDGLAAVRVGRNWRITKWALQRWLDQREAQAA